MRLLLCVLVSLFILGCSKKTSEEHLSAAREYIANQDNAAAIVELKNAVQLSPESAQIRFELGRVYFENEQFESAEKELNRALEYGYDSAKIIPMLSEAYKKTGALVAATSVDHNDSGLSVAEQLKVGYLKLDALIKLDKQSDAELLVEELRQLDSASYYRELVEAYSKILRKDFDAALALVEETRKSEPYAEDVLKLQARILLQLERPSEASDVYLDYIKVHSRDVQVKFILAKLLVDQNRLQEAEPFIDDLLTLSAEHALLNQMKSLVSASNNDYDLAQKHAEVAIQQGTNDPIARLIAGYAAYQKQDYQDANRHLSVIASALPDEHPGVRILAASQLQLGMTEDASELLERVEQINANDAALFSKTSYELLSAGRIKQAKELVERTEAITESAEDLARLGVLKLSLNNVEGILNLEQAVAKAPDYTPAQTTLANAYLFSGKYAEAEELATKWIAREPDNPKAYLLLGNIQLQQKKLQDAMSNIEQALALDAEFVEAQMSRINILYSQGNNVDAASSLDQLLSKQPAYVPALAAHFLFNYQQAGFDSAAAPTIRVLQQQPENSELKLLLARMHFSNQDFASAAEALDDIKANEQTPNAYWSMRGQALLRAGKGKLANEHYETWLELDRYNKDAVLGSLLLMDSQNEFAEALALTEDFLDKRDDLQMQVLQTHFLLMNRRFEDARGFYQGFSDEVKALPFVKGMQARLQIFDKQLEAALPNATAAYEANKNLRNLLLLLFTLENLEQNDKAMQTLEQFVENNPTQPAAMMVLAERQIGKDVNSAMSTYQTILELTPNNFVVLNNLAFLKKEQGELAQARTLAEKAVSIQPQSAEALDTLAQILVQEQELEDALKYYARIDAKGLENEEIFLNYLETLLASDQTRLALRQLEDRELTQQDSIQRWSKLKQKYQL